MKVDENAMAPRRCTSYGSRDLLHVTRHDGHDPLHLGGWLEHAHALEFPALNGPCHKCRSEWFLCVETGGARALSNSKGQSWAPNLYL